MTGTVIGWQRCDSTGHVEPIELAYYSIGDSGRTQATLFMHHTHCSFVYILYCLDDGIITLKVY